MKILNLNEHPHRRLNLLTGEWILVSPHRAKRPWQGKVETIPAEKKAVYDPECYLCPGNTRAGGRKNPPYTETFVFDNDFSALQMETFAVELSHGSLLQAQGESGICRVICFSPRHDLTLPEMSTEAIGKVVQVWTDQYRALGEKPEITYVQIFENKGEIMGCSNPHPHGQIWAEATLPVEPAKEDHQQRSYLSKNNRCLLCDYLRLERELNERVVFENDLFVVMVPFWAVWPFETMILPRKHIGSLLELSDEGNLALAEAIREITVRYDNLFNTSFPYSAGFHQSPTDGKQHPAWHLHMHFYPPLLRSATVKKFMVGYEMLANPQRDITPEWSAKKLRETSDVHYKSS